MAQRKRATTFVVKMRLIKSTTAKGGEGLGLTREIKGRKGGRSNQEKIKRLGRAALRAGGAKGRDLRRKRTGARRRRRAESKRVKLMRRRGAGVGGLGLGMRKRNPENTLMTRWRT